MEDININPIHILKEIALPGFEPGSQASKARILDHCNTGLYNFNLNGIYKSFDTIQNAKTFKEKFSTK